MMGKIGAIVNHAIIWAEVWGLFIPLYFVIRQKFNKKLNPIPVYILSALVLNLLANIVANQKELGIELPWHSNVALYNLHSIVMLVIFSIFFFQLGLFSRIKRLIRASIFVLIALCFIGSILEFFFSGLISNYSYALASLTLLLFCIAYYLKSLREDTVKHPNQATFWVVTGLSIFIVITLPIFIFYKQAAIENLQLANRIWLLQNVAYLIFCLFLGFGFSIPKDRYAHE